MQNQFARARRKGGEHRRGGGSQLAIFMTSWTPMINQTRHFAWYSALAWGLTKPFLPMNRNSLNDPKVRWQKGEGGAPKEAEVRIDCLQSAYQKHAQALSAIGMNGDVLDLEIPEVEKPEIPEDEEAKAEELVKNGVVYKAGGLVRLGVVIANGRVMQKAERMLIEKQKEEAAAKEKKKRDEAETREEKSFLAYDHWIRGQKKDGTDARAHDKDGNPKLPKQDAIAIVRVLLPRFAPKEKMSDYGGMSKCVKWLGSLAGRGTTWEEEITAVRREYSAACVARSKPLF
mmetsp:Transcript_19445/g.46675  ORF Transcript_19445/g.46675 Transcript_19445/m.46675 type:complete len:287 (+) Transcript_19445:384-1244(+)